MLGEVYEFNLFSSALFLSGVLCFHFEYTENCYYLLMISMLCFLLNKLKLNLY